MRALKLIFVLFIELLAEALLLGCLLGVLASSQVSLLYGVIGSVLAVPVVLFLHGYYLTRSLAGVVLRSRRQWLYPAVAAVLFVAHMHFALARSKSDLTPFAQATELPFLAGGACIVFACAFFGDRFLQKWTQTGGHGPEPQHRRDRTRQCWCLIPLTRDKVSCH